MQEGWIENPKERGAVQLVVEEGGAMLALSQTPRTVAVLQTAKKTQRNLVHHAAPVRPDHRAALKQKRKLRVKAKENLVSMTQACQQITHSPKATTFRELWAVLKFQTT